MSLDNELLKELSQKMGSVSKRRVYQKLKEIEEEQLISKEEAACLLAYHYKIPIKKYFEQEIIKNVREIIQKGKVQPLKIPTSKKIEIKETIFRVNFNKIFRNIKEPLLPSSIINDARKMATYYPLFYVFENSIRNFINLVMSNKYGKNWWEEKIKKNKFFENMCRKIEERKTAENEFRWHSKRGAHEIFYTDVEDLRKIVSHHWSDFEPVLKNLSWYDNMLRTLNMSRRIIAHNNPLSDRDFNRIKSAFYDWCDQIKLTKDKFGV